VLVERGVSADFDLACFRFPKSECFLRFTVANKNASNALLFASFLLSAFGMWKYSTEPKKRRLNTSARCANLRMVWLVRL
jgi:hypothetical protein